MEPRILPSHQRSCRGILNVPGIAYFQKYIIPLRPDIVLVNCCENDLLPTEDPFDNIRGIYVQYLNQVLESRDLALAVEEKSDIKSLFASSSLQNAFGTQ